MKLPGRGDDVWWDVLEAAHGALAILEDREAWTTKARAARRWSRKHPGTKKACGPLDRRAVKWSATGALELAAGAHDAPAVVVALEVARRTGRTLSRQEEDGHRATLGALLAVAAAASSRLGFRERGTVRPRRMKQLPLFAAPQPAQERLSVDEGPPTARSAVRASRGRRRAA